MQARKRAERRERQHQEMEQEADAIAKLREQAADASGAEADKLSAEVEKRQKALDHRKAWHDARRCAVAAAAPQQRGGEGEPTEQSEIAAMARCEASLQEPAAECRRHFVGRRVAPRST